MVTILRIATAARCALLDVTAQVQQAVTASGISAGVCHVYVPHTTAGVTINENADPDVKRDLLAALDRMVPHGAAYSHGEGNSPAHVKATLVGASALVPVENGRLVLGTWQGILFCEFDGPRQRTLLVNVMP
jgi:secondary thiamine-phosphate synthase enzyme